MMVSKTVKCPKCGEQSTMEGAIGEKTIITCPSCGTKGQFTFSAEKTKIKTIDGINAIEVNGFVKDYKGFKALDNISFSVKKGEIFGFLGPNGAGKTTTIKILITIIKPTKGTAKIGGYDIIKNSLEFKKRIGYMPDIPGFYGEMKAVDVLNFYAEFYKIPKDRRKRKINELLEMMQLTEFKNRKVKTYSRGMKQKLGFASFLINDPEILILDEPTIGLDPATIHFFRKKLEELNKKGVTIFLSSHILSEIEAICDRVCIINKGKIITVDTIDSLGEKMSSKSNKTVHIKFENITEEARKAVAEIDGVLSAKINDEYNHLEIEIERGKQIIPIINKTLVENNIAVTGIETKEINLEDIFLSLTGSYGGD